MSLKAESAKLYLSFLWWILEPLFMVAIFYFVFAILLKSDQKDFIVFLMCAKIPFLWFSKAVTIASGSIVADKSIVSNVDIPKTIFPYAAIQVSLYKEAPVFVVLLLLSMAFGYMPTIDWILLIPLIILEYIMIVFFSLLFALMVCYVDDVRMLIHMIMMGLMFVSGVFFDVSSINPAIAHYVIGLNPVAFLCDGFRSILMGTKRFDLSIYCMYLFLFSGGVAFMHLVYLRYSRAIAARVINS
jgi:lipopolysaccharide transport system permease protein